MEEYQFQYTKFGITLFVILVCIAISGTIIFLGAYFRFPQIPIFIFALLAPILSFSILKGKAVGNCNAKLSDSFVLFEFEDNTAKKIDFKSLKSFRQYYGKNGPILYLTSPLENFKVAANSKFCNPASFTAFSKEVINKLDNYRNTIAPTLIHKGSIFVFDRHKSS